MNEEILHIFQNINMTNKEKKIYKANYNEQLGVKSSKAQNY